MKPVVIPPEVVEAACNAWDEDRNMEAALAKWIDTGRATRQIIGGDGECIIIRLEGEPS